MSSSMNSNTTPLLKDRVRHGDGRVDGAGPGVGGGAGIELRAHTVEVDALESASAEPTTRSTGPVCLCARLSTS